MTRQEYILYLLRERNRITVEELSNALSVSHITIRRDLKDLETQGMLSRIHGGATLPFSMHDKTINSKEKINIAEKKRIAKKAGDIILPDKIVFVNGGTTTAACIGELDVPRISIYTNNIVLLSTQCSDNIQIHYLGGDLNLHTKVFYGEITQSTVDAIKADYCLLGVNSISIEEGISSFSISEAAINRKMIKNTLGKVIVVADYTKINKVSNFKVCEIDEIDVLITDSACSESFQKEVTEMGITVWAV